MPKIICKGKVYKTFPYTKEGYRRARVALAKHRMKRGHRKCYLKHSM